MVVVAVVVIVLLLSIGGWWWYTTTRSAKCLEDEPALRRAIARGPCLVFFFAPWCPVCPTAKEHFDRNVHHFRVHNPHVAVHTFDVTSMEASTLHEEFGVETVPHTLLIHHDKHTVVQDVATFRC